MSWGEASPRTGVILRPEEVAVVFVNYHSETLIRPKAARFREAGFEVLVSDNSGTYQDSGTSLVTMSGNEGFGAGCNRAVEAASPAVRFICFHNPDVEIAVKAVAELACWLADQPSPAAVAPAELTFGHLRAAGYHYPSPGREAFLCLRSLVRIRAPLAGRQAAGRIPGTPAAAPALGARWSGTRGLRFPGAGLLVVDRRAHERIDGFDERYFLYAEDLDYWHRLRSAGYVTVINPAFIARHDSSTGSPLAADRREILRWLGVELFMEKFDHNSVRLVRPIHRWSLRLLAPAWPEVTAKLSSAWRDGMPPAACLAQLRPILQRP